MHKLHSDFNVIRFADVTKTRVVTTLIVPVQTGRRKCLLGRIFFKLMLSRIIYMRQKLRNTKFPINTGNIRNSGDQVFLATLTSKCFEIFQ